MTLKRVLARIGLAALIAGGAMAPAIACKPQSPVKRLADLRRSAHFEGAVLVSVLGARFRSESGYLSWQALGAVQRVLAGPIIPERSYQFRNQVCDFLEATPKQGDRWVLYLAKDYRGKVTVNSAYSLRLALKLDPKLAPRLR